MIKKYIFGFIVTFLVGLMIGMIPFNEGGVVHGNNDDWGDFFEFDKIIPSQLAEKMRNNFLIEDVIINENASVSYVLYNLTFINSQLPSEYQQTHQTIEKYFNAIDDKLDNYMAGMIFFPEFIMPETCGRTLGNTMFATYRYENGTQFLKFNDAFCLEVWNG